MTKFLNEQDSNGGGGHNITINVQGNASSETVEEIKKAVIDGIREASERGEPIMSERGLVREG